MSSDITYVFTQSDVFARPGAGTGLWLMTLLPLSLLVSTFKHPIVVTPTYKLTSILATGLLCTSVVIALQCRKKQSPKMLKVWNLLCWLFTSALFHVCLQKGSLFCFMSGFISTIVYYKLYLFLLDKFRRNFTLGEAGFVAQSLVIFLFNTGLNLMNNSGSRKSVMQKSTLIVQMGLLTVIIIAFLTYKFKLKSPKWFYTTVIFVLVFILFLPLHILLDGSPVLWILLLLFENTHTVKLVLYWSFCSGLAVLAVSNQIFYAKKASTGTRKIFHIISVLVYIPGLLYKCSLLYLATGIVLGIFFALEILRVLRIPPLGLYLQDGYVVFSDEKDVGPLALTPIYLLVGCSLPLWLHPSPCDVTDSAVFNMLPLLSGLLSVGIGDTAASFVGSNFGKIHWPGSKKTVEGTVACILGQFAFIYLLIYFGHLEYLNQTDYTKIGLAVIVTSIIEARTTQIDNLVLPLIMYIILI